MIVCEVVSTSNISDLEKIYELIPDPIKEYVSLNEFSSIDSLLDIGNVFRFITKVLFLSFYEFRPQYSLFFTVSVIVFIYGSLHKSLRNSTSALCDTAVIAVLSCSITELLLSITKSFADKYLQLSGFVSSASAVCVTSMASSASGASAAVLGSVCSVIVSVFNSVCSTVIYPFVCIYLTLNICGSVTGDYNVGRISSFVRNTTFGVVGFLLALFSSVMSVQSVISLGKDTLLKKTLKNILSSGLPILGGAVSEGVDTFFLTAVEVKNSIGSIGITVTVLYCLYPMCEILLCFLALTSVIFALGFFEDVPIRDFLMSIRDVLSVIMCICIALTVMTVLLFYFIIKVV